MKDSTVRYGLKQENLLTTKGDRMAPKGSYEGQYRKVRPEVEKPADDEVGRMAPKSRGLCPQPEVGTNC